MNIQNYNQFTNSLTGKKVLVWGLGVSGGGLNIAKYFLSHNAQVRVTDLKTEDELKDSLDELKDSSAEIVLGEHREQDFLWADLIIKNPAIPKASKWNTFIEDNNLEVAMELDLFLKYYPGKVIGITGTRGKSTTTALIFEMLRYAGKDVFTGGNNKLPLLTQLDKANPEQIAVVEMSSFQLSSVNNSPHIAIVTNIYPDHLNWHTDMQDYIEAKMNITRFQTEEDTKILNINNTEVKDNFRNSGQGELITVGQDGDYHVSEGTIFKGDTPCISETELKIKGNHNLSNVAMAIAAIEAIKVDFQKVKKPLAEFETLLYRQQLVKESNGIRFINDSCATSPDGVIAAVERFSSEAEGRLFLITGGVDKGVELTELVKTLNEKAPEIYFLEGSLFEAMSKDLKKELIHGPFNSFETILNELRQILEPGDIVLLSPGGSSFNLFVNEWDRGEKFNEAVIAQFTTKI